MRALLVFAAMLACRKAETTENRAAPAPAAKPKEKVGHPAGVAVRYAGETKDAAATLIGIRADKTAVIREIEHCYPGACGSDRIVTIDLASKKEVDRFTAPRACPPAAPDFRVAKLEAELYADSRHVSLSPDGKRAGWVCDDTKDVTVADPDGAAPKTVPSSVFRRPVFSPDSKWLVWSVLSSSDPAIGKFSMGHAEYEKGTGEHNPSDLIVLDIAAWKPRRVRVEFTPDGFAWSPDSTTVYTFGGRIHVGEECVWSLNVADATEAKKVTCVPNWGSRSIAVAHDGKSAAFIGDSAVVWLDLVSGAKKSQQKGLKNEWLLTDSGTLISRTSLFTVDLMSGAITQPKTSNAYVSAAPIDPTHVMFVALSGYRDPHYELVSFTLGN